MYYVMLIEMKMIYVFCYVGLFVFFVLMMFGVYDMLCVVYVLI